MGTSVKIVVPPGMQLAFVHAMQDRFGSVPGGTAVGIEAVLRWQDSELEKMIQGDPYENDLYMRTESLNENAVRTGFNKAIRVVRGMFLEPEPKEMTAECLLEYLNHSDIDNGAKIVALMLYRDGKKVGK